MGDVIKSTASRLSRWKKAGFSLELQASSVLNSFMKESCDPIKLPGCCIKLTTLHGVLVAYGFVEAKVGHSMCKHFRKGWVMTYLIISLKGILSQTLHVWNSCRHLPHV